MTETCLALLNLKQPPAPATQKSIGPLAFHFSQHSTNHHRKIQTWWRRQQQQQQRRRPASQPATEIRTTFKLGNKKKIWRTNENVRLKVASAINRPEKKQTVDIGPIAD